MPLMGDTRAWPLTVAGTDDLRRVVGRVLVNRQGEVIEIVIDDPHITHDVTTVFKEGSYQIEVA
jgi:hypothetical protein